MISGFFAAVGICGGASHAGVGLPSWQSGWFRQSITDRIGELKTADGWTRIRRTHGTEVQLRLECAVEFVFRSDMDNAHGRVTRRCFISGLVVLGGGILASSPTLAQDTVVSARFLSLKTDRVVVRAAPGADHPIAWVFQRAGLPVEGLRAVDGWREIRDAEGSAGWVQTRVLSLRRTVIVTGRGATANAVALRARAQASADAVMMIEPGIVAGLVACDGTWCQVSLADVRGYLAQSDVWGVGPGEVVKPLI